MPDITKQDILAWLDMQRDAVNTEIVYAAPSEQKQYHKNLQIINAIEARMQEMTAVEYLEAIDVAPPAVTRKLAQVVGKDNRLTVAVVKKWKEERDGND